MHVHASGASVRIKYSKSLIEQSPQMQVYELNTLIEQSPQMLINLTPIYNWLSIKSELGNLVNQGFVTEKCGFMLHHTTCVTTKSVASSHVVRPVLEP